MNVMDEILDKYSVKYQDLSSEEKESLNTMVSSFEMKTLTVDNIRTHIQNMQGSVIQELTKMDHNTIDDIFLKARLRNYTLLLALLQSPEKARREIERAVEGIRPPKTR